MCFDVMGVHSVSVFLFSVMVNGVRLTINGSEFLQDTWGNRSRGLSVSEGDWVQDLLGYQNLQMLKSVA